MVKHTVKSFKRENKFHTYLTRETLPAEERVSKFHNHGETSSCQILANASDATSRAFVEGRTHKFIVQRLKFQLGHVSFSTCFPRENKPSNYTSLFLFTHMWLTVKDIQKTNKNVFSMFELFTRLSMRQ